MILLILYIGIKECSNYILILKLPIEKMIFNQ